nr:reverse transcriptase domain-containing protein [Tanacetum cinerariifolium]
NGRKADISFLYVFEALCYPKNDRENIGKLGAKGDIGFFIGYSADSCAYRVFNRRSKKIMETINVSFDELSAMDFEQRSSKPELQSITSGQISSGLDLTYAPSTITIQQPTEGICQLVSIRLILVTSSPRNNTCRRQDKPLNFKGTEGVVGLTRWFKKMETVFYISNCSQKCQVKYASCTLQDNALTWWNSYKRTIGTDAAYAMTWNKLMKLMTEVKEKQEKDKIESKSNQNGKRGEARKSQKQLQSRKKEK